MDSLGCSFFCFYILVGVIVLCDGISVVSSSCSSRSRRQLDQSSGQCKRPDIPENGEYLIIPNTPVGRQNLPLNTILRYNCDEGYTLSKGVSLLVCLNYGWSQKPPTCGKYCSPLYNTASTNVTCLDERKINIECDQVMDGAEARFSCAKFYESNEKNKHTIYCRNGTWDRPPLECTPVCGKKRLPAESPMKGSEETGTNPWATAIFRKDDEVLNICAGTMLSPRIILTAAHCVSDSSGAAFDPAKVIVAVGKQYSKYQDRRDHNAQYSDVEKVVIHPRYRGDVQRYGSDIAFLVTKDTLVLTEAVQPVCFNNLPNIHLTSESRGEIAGWVVPSSNGSYALSEKIMETPLSYKDEATCRKELPPDFLDKYYINDKICAGYHDDGTVPCPKPSGKGLIFKNPEDGLYYVHGILSLGPNLATSRCGTATTSLYTNVAVYYEMLEQTVSEYQ